jgi:hypothetical protein
VSVQVDIAVAKFKAIKRAKEAIEKRERDLERFTSRLSKEEFNSFAKATEEINQA